MGHGTNIANHIVIDTRHTKLQYEGIEKKVQFEVNSKASIKKAILINKFGKIVEIPKMSMIQ